MRWLSDLKRSERMWLRWSQNPSLALGLHFNCLDKLRIEKPGIETHSPMLSLEYIFTESSNVMFLGRVEVSNLFLHSVVNMANKSPLEIRVELAQLARAIF